VPFVARTGQTVDGYLRVRAAHPHAFRHTFPRVAGNDGQERDLMHLAGAIDLMLQVWARTTAVERAHDAHRR
jgi:hypothetical protein